MSILEKDKTANQVLGVVDQFWKQKWYSASVLYTIFYRKGVIGIGTKVERKQRISKEMDSLRKGWETCREREG